MRSTIWGVVLAVGLGVVAGLVISQAGGHEDANVKALSKQPTTTSEATTTSTSSETTTTSLTVDTTPPQQVAFSDVPQTAPGIRRVRRTSTPTTAKKSPPTTARPTGATTPPTTSPPTTSPPTTTPPTTTPPTTQDPGPTTTCVGMTTPPYYRCG